MYSVRVGASVGTCAKAIGSCFLRRRRQEGTREQCGVENDWAACWSITRGKRHIKSTGQLAMGSQWAQRMPGISPGKRPPAP